MNLYFTSVLVAAAIGCDLSAEMGAADAEENPRTNEVIPLIVMDQVPLADAIKNLARQAGINYILDPRLSDSGSGEKHASVNVRWENMSAEQALSRLLNEHKLAMIQGPATSVRRITYTNQVAVPAPSGESSNGTNHIIPLIAMDEVPLESAIQNLARQIQLEVVFDPKLSEANSFRAASVSIRWENLTGRQALSALLENYDLMMVEDRSGSVRITPKATGAPTLPSATQEPIKKAGQD